LKPDRPVLRKKDEIYLNGKAFTGATMKTIPWKQCAGVTAGALVVFLSIAAVAYGAKKTAKTADKKGADTTAIKVVVTDIQERAFQDWGSYSADLRGIDDVVLNAPAQGGKVESVKEVGTYVREGDALCNVDSEKYEVALDAAKAQVELTKGDLERVKVNVEKGSLGKSAIDGANLAFQNARMALVNATNSYEDCRCQAPFSGVLVSRSIEKYQTVAPGMPLVRIARIDQLQATIAIPEADAFKYEEGMKTEFRLLQNQDEMYEGTIKSIDRAVDPNSRTITARIVISNKDRSLKPGMVGRANILRRTYEKAIVIPSVALVRLQNEITVMIVERGLARQHIVTVGATAGDSTLVTSGLAIGDKLIITGAFQVSDGTRVTY
jgi:RND family efflux transporter MFP subunit